jgi:hypothetical protein
MSMQSYSVVFGLPHICRQRMGLFSIPLVFIESCTHVHGLEFGLWGG